MQCDDLYNIKSTCKKTKVSAVSQNMNIESKSCQVLTIETVRQKDFGTYACVVRNSLGEVVLIYIFTFIYLQWSALFSHCLILFQCPIFTNLHSFKGSEDCSAPRNENWAEPNSKQKLKVHNHNQNIKVQKTKLSRNWKY